jgi:Domain of unknown function (DUF4177)
MSIEVACACGKTFKAKDEHAGLKGRCPQCGSTLAIPQLPSHRALNSDSADVSMSRTVSMPQRDSVPPSPAQELRIADLRAALEEDRLGTDREATLTDVWKVLNSIASSMRSASPSTSAGASQQREYKVITQKDKWFSGKFDPEKVEGVLNSYAKQGWALKGVATASIPGFAGGQREEIVIIMER